MEAGSDNPTAPITTSAVLERDTELEALGAVLDAAREGAGRLLIIEGHAGAGKSQLLAAARGFAKGTGMASLRARARRGST
jgi:predicted ATPase